MIGFNSFEDAGADVSAAQMEAQKDRQELKDIQAALVQCPHPFLSRVVGRKRGESCVVPGCGKSATDPVHDWLNTSNRVGVLEEALRTIASLHPDPGMCAELVPEWVGPNEGRMRAETLWYALNTARKALGLPTYPEPEHWGKKDK